MKKPLFISIEGIEGAGKSSLIPQLCTWLQSFGREVVSTREPGGCPVSEAIRTLVLAHYEHPMEADCELLLMMAARVQHLSEVILPALSQGKTVVSDRFRDATLAYQGGGRSIPLERILSLEKWLRNMRLPDKTFYLDISLEESHRRRQGRSFDRIEQEQDLFFERVRSTYLQLSEENPDRIIILDATQKSEHILQEIASALAHDV